MRLPGVRLLPLTALVPFPCAPPYAVSAPGVECGSAVGLIRSVAGELARVGVVASVDSAEGGVLMCRPTSDRFRLAEPLPADASPPLLGTIEMFADDAEDEAGAVVGAPELLSAELHESVWRQLSDLHELQQREAGVESELPPRLVALRPGHGSASDFSFALASVCELDPDEAQRILELRSASERLAALEASVGEAVKFCAAQAAIRSLGGLLGG